MKVDKEKCIACGMCVKDCIVRDIEIVDNKAEIKNEKCFKCGHCIAICPKDAVSSDVYDMNEVKPYNKEEFDISPDNLLNFIKFRRSTRHFKDKDVEKEKLEKILEAGRFTQTGSNSQNVSYVVVKDSLDKLKTEFKDRKIKHDINDLKRDLGWFDGPAVRHSIALTGAKSICINCMDVIAQLPKVTDSVKICFAYKNIKTGEVTYDWPYHLQDYKPLYMEMSLKGKNKNQIIADCINLIEIVIGQKIEGDGVGPSREGYRKREEAFRSL